MVSRPTFDCEFDVEPDAIDDLHHGGVRWEVEDASHRVELSAQLREPLPRLSGVVQRTGIVERLEQRDRF